MQGKDHTREQNFEEITSASIQPHTHHCLSKNIFNKLHKGKTCARRNEMQFYKHKHKELQIVTIVFLT
jgi:hypothetical protein